jgi:hypothetical protein
MGKFGLQLALLGLTAVSLAISVACTLVHVRTVGELRSLQAQSVLINQRQAQAQAVAAAALEYSKRDPGIDPILITVGAKIRPASAAPAPAPNSPAKGAPAK